MSSCGYCYFVTRLLNDGKPDLSRVKGGYSEELMIEEFIYKNYSRILTPIYVLDIIPASNASLTEKLFFHTLNKYRVDEKHEIFDLESDESRDMLERTKEIQYNIDILSGLPFPPVREISYKKWIENKNKKKKIKIEKEKNQVLPHFIEFFADSLSNKKNISKSALSLFNNYKKFLEDKNISGWGINNKIFVKELDKYSVENNGFIEKKDENVFIYNIENMKTWMTKNNINTDKFDKKIKFSKKTPISMLPDYFIHKKDILPHNTEIKITATSLMKEFLTFIEKDFPNAKNKINNTNFGLELKKNYLLDHSGFIDKSRSNGLSTYFYNTKDLSEWLITNKYM